MHNPELLKAWAALVSGVAQLLWPVVAFSAIVIFRKQLVHILGRLKRGKLFGNELEFESKVEQLSEKATQVEEFPAIAKQPIEALKAPTTREQSEGIDGRPVPTLTGPIDDDQRASNPDQDASPPYPEKLSKVIGGETLDSIIETGRLSPSTGVLLLAAQIERSVNYFLAAQGLWSERTHFFVRNVETLCRKELLPPELRELAQIFWNVRNRISHGSRAPKNVVSSAFESGVTLYKAILDLPYPITRIRYASIRLYTDQNATTALSGTTGVILTLSTKLGSVDDIFPVAIENSYKPGQVVSWEWRAEIVRECWYREPATGSIRNAWSQSSLFAGRDVFELIDS
jgi:hypothetical protein